ALTDRHAEDQGPLIAGAKRLEAGRRRHLRAPLRFRTRIIDGDEPTVAVERDAAAPDEMLQAEGDRGQPVIGRQATDPIAVLLAQIDIVGTRVDGEAAERGLAWRLGERDHDARRALGVDRQRARDVEAMDLTRGVAAAPVAEDDETSRAIGGELDRPPDMRYRELRCETGRGHDPHGRTR